MSSRKILIISYYWPPSGGVGVQRWMNFAIQLKHRRWEPIIYTPENPQFEIRDEGLITTVKGIRVVKTPIWEPFDLFHKITGNRERKNVQQGLVLEKSNKSFLDKVIVWIRGNVLIPDPRVFWVGRSVKFLRKFLEEEGINTIITTGPPHSIHLIGKRLKKQLIVNWIADFRDPWSKWDVLKKLETSTLSMALHEYLEKRVLDSADIVTTVSKRLAASFQSRTSSSVKILTNGITIKKPNVSTPDEESFTIGYFGMLNEMRNPNQLWHVLDQLCREDKQFNARLQIKIGGIVAESIKSELLSMERLKDKVQLLGCMPHEEVQTMYAECNLLLLLLNKTDNAQWILPVKFFEYLGAHRKILALGKRDSDLGDLMNGKNIGELLDYSNVSALRIFIKQAFDEKEGPDGSAIDELIDRFAHEHLVARLETIINELNG